MNLGYRRTIAVGFCGAVGFGVGQLVTGYGMTGKAEIFDRALLHGRWRRALRRGGGVRTGTTEWPDFLLAHAGRDITERLGMIRRTFQRAVSIGDYHGVVAGALRAAGVKEVIETAAVPELLTIIAAEARGASIVADEEALALTLTPGTFDLAVAVLSLHYVNDLVGVLGQIERLLRPDGLFIGVLLGGETLSELRQAMLAAEAEVSGGASPRVMPFVDVRDAGRLLQRTGFAMPVSDAEALTVSYRSALDLMHELKAMGATNVLHDRSRVPMTRGLLLRTAEIYAERFAADDGPGRVRATFELVTLTGWAPAVGQ